MKKASIILTLCLFAATSEAQTFEEWFQQKKTQKKYLLQQIAALKVYFGCVEKGYEISQFGLKTIGDIKDGDLGQHTDYFNSLKNINPNIEEYSLTKNIGAVQSSIIKLHHDLIIDIQESDSFTPDEVDYIHRVFSRLLSDCNKNIRALSEITSSGKLEMKDNERMKYIDALYLDMQDNLVFAQSFRRDALMLAASRIHTKNEFQKGLTIHGIKIE